MSTDKLVPVTPSRVRRTRAEQRAETRRRLLEAAARVFVRRGYEAASVEEIAETAGFTRGAVYSNFRDKDDLYVTFLEERMAEKVTQIGTAVAGISEWSERRRVLRECFIGHRWEDPETPVLYAELQLAAARHPVLRRRLRTLFERHVEAFARLALDICGDVPESFRTVFLALFATTEGITLLKASGHVNDEAAEKALGIVFDAAVSQLEPALAAQR